MDGVETARLVLHPMSVAEARRVVSGEPDAQARWAPGYPTAGDVVAATRLVGAYGGGGDPWPFGNYEIRRREDGYAIGGIGFHGPPDETGSVAIGYGLAESARGLGYASEALRALLALARAHGAARVLGDTTHGNVASQRVMTAAGMLPTGQDAQLRYYALDLADGGGDEDTTAAPPGH